MYFANKIYRGKEKCTRIILSHAGVVGSVAEWLACRTQLKAWVQIAAATLSVKAVLSRVSETRRSSMFPLCRACVTQDVIQKPMIRTESKLVKKDAPDLFRLIQAYMGDRKITGGRSDAPTTTAGLLTDVLVKGWNVVELRDEIFIQICRQTTRNPREYEPAIALTITHTHARTHTHTHTHSHLTAFCPGQPG